MLNIYFGYIKDMIYKTSNYFDAMFEEEWLESELVKEMIKDIDKSEVLDNNLIKSPIFGLMPPQWLSGGVKTLILILNIDDRIINVSQCGENCYKWLLEIGKEKDVKVRVGNFMDFSDVQNDEKINIIWNKGNNQDIVKTPLEFLNIFNKARECGDFDDWKWDEC